MESIQLAVLHSQDISSSQILLMKTRFDSVFFPSCLSLPYFQLTTDDALISGCFDFLKQHGFPKLKKNDITENLVFLSVDEMDISAQHYEFHHYCMSQKFANWLCQSANNEFVVLNNMAEIEYLYQNTHYLFNPLLERFLFYDFKNSYKKLYFELLPGLELGFLPSTAMPSPNFTLSMIFGDYHKTIVDPSPNEETIYKKILNKCLGFSINGILVSHHHPDHISYIDSLAKELDAPLLMHKNTKRKLREQKPSILEGVRVQEIQDGEIINHWRGQAIRAIHIPGHASGQIGLVAECKTWIYISDIARRHGGILIPETDGCMSQYFNSLQKIKKINSKFFLYSHETPEHGSKIVDFSILHRTKQENRILKYINEGVNTEDKIFDRMYQGIEQEMKKYALMNIRMHMKKILENG